MKEQEISERTWDYVDAWFETESVYNQPKTIQL